MSNASVQSVLIRLGLLDPPADGKWGALSKQALCEFQRLNRLPVNGQITPETAQAFSVVSPSEFPGTDLASRICNYMRNANFYVATGSCRFNIVYLEGADANGVPNADVFNEWNDRRLLIEIVGNVPRIVGNWLATTEPGSTYTFNPMNRDGAFRIAFGQYQAWSFGRHGRTQYPALVQTGTIAGHRDKNKDGLRTGDIRVVGSKMEVNQHHGWDMNFVNNASAGCLVGQSIEGHWKFLEILHTDRRATPNYQFFTTIIDATELTKFSSRSVIT